MGLLVNHAKKWAFIHIPKTGGTSVTEILCNIPETITVNSHGTLNDLRGIEDYFIFSFVRNPYTRLSSWYEHKKRDGIHQPFDSFIHSIDSLDYLFFSQEYYLYHGKTDKKQISFVGKYENFENDLKKILDKLEIKYDNIPHLNSNLYYKKHPNLNTDKLYKKYYTQQWMKDWVKEKYKNDFKLFGYDLEI